MKTTEVYMLLHETVVSIVDMYVLPAKACIVAEVCIVVKCSLKTFKNCDRA